MIVYFNGNKFTQSVGAQVDENVYRQSCNLASLLTLFLLFYFLLGITSTINKDTKILQNIRSFIFNIFLVNFLPANAKLNLAIDCVVFHFQPGTSRRRRVSRSETISKKNTPNYSLRKTCVIILFDLRYVYPLVYPRYMSCLEYYEKYFARSVRLSGKLIND